MTRESAQKPACKDLGRNGQCPIITPKAAYTSVANRADSRSHTKRGEQSSSPPRFFVPYCF
ncbi:IMP cyclohydrolase [Lacticaseibacillus paracasei]|nr:IMP cyclohydrolase [Lacticaseibacillus paracasei]PTS56825.1 IMP cyclohydrolase [Lactobacillus sp. DS22_6]MCT3343600.1 IMP cyclohydrolase [Lacticaseibacillus paracasei]MCT3361909.1 IMP cyclohydrolase [Lacticaseibacillus paracasei]RDF81661.1 IMP cyclohydrolase [Lacticaseibacillus paracasei]